MLNFEFEKPPIQSTLPNCWLIAPLEVLWATRRDLLKSIVSEIDGYKIQVRLAKHVLWLNPCFPPNTANPLWARCIEKAFSILLGGYHKFKPGRVAYACSLLFKEFRIVEIKNGISVIKLPGGHHSLKPVECYMLYIDS